ncbi:MAG: sulfatase-like hydrolase/transferase [Oscillospiraceae bacterium]|nr:sulfatase-like hydrolase/transferase [Oscillospiraceae bacterium]
MKKRPNILFILTDDQRAGTIHALGNDEIKTPNMDRLVERGTAFTRAYIPGGTASAVCMPSRAMLNSGKTLFHLEESGKNIPACDTTMGQCFLDNGYHAAAIGKWHNGVASFSRSFDNGADIFFGGMWDHWNVPVNDFHQDKVYDSQIHFVPNFSASSESVKVLADRINAGVHSTDLFSGAAVDYIENYDSEQPFFMYLSYLAPHDPRTMPEEFRNMYDPADISLPPNFYEMPVVNCGWSNKGRDENTEAYPRRPDAIKKHIADYYAMISHIDSGVGKVIEALEKKGMLEDTIIVLTGDNGLAIGQHGLMGKQNIYDHSVHVPLVMCGPGIEKGQRNENFVYLLDIFPTLCELCGMEIPASVDGKSFAPMFSDAGYKTRNELYLAFQSRIRGVMDERYKLIEYRTDDLKLTQLFDLKNDPWEKNNFYDIAGYEDIAANLREKLFALRDEWEDESTIFGQQYWKQWRQYEEAAVHGVGKPKGVNMANQVKDWGTDKK